MKKAEIIKANSVLLLANTIVRLDTTNKMGPIIQKIDKVMSAYNTPKNVGMNVLANTKAEELLEWIKTKYSCAISAQLVVCHMLLMLQERGGMPKLYRMPLGTIVNTINTIADESDDKDLLNNSISVAEDLFEEAMK